MLPAPALDNWKVRNRVWNIEKVKGHVGVMEWKSKIPIIKQSYLVNFLYALKSHKVSGVPVLPFPFWFWSPCLCHLFKRCVDIHFALESGKWKKLNKQNNNRSLEFITFIAHKDIRMRCVVQKGNPEQARRPTRWAPYIHNTQYILYTHLKIQ